MAAPENTDKQAILNRIATMRLITALVIFVENSVIYLWKPACWLAFFCGLWLWNIHSITGHIIATIIVLLFVFGIIILLRPAFMALRWPDRNAVSRRLEKHNALKHRPLDNIEDTLVNPAQTRTIALWIASKERAFTALAALRPASLMIPIAALDPYALRYAALLLFLSGMVFAGTDWTHRIQSGFMPFSPPDLTQEHSSKYTIWITPPDYTGQEQIIIQDIRTVDSPVDIIEGSSVKVTLSGGWLTPHYTVDNLSEPLLKIDNEHWILERTAINGDAIKISQLPFTFITLPYHYIEDTPPEIALVEAPEPLGNGELSTTLAVQDDFGVKELHIAMKLADHVENPPMGTEYSETRILITAAKTPTETTPIYDLSWHPWAGMPVTMMFSVTDHIGQTGSLPPITVTLPERRFTDPVAQNIANMRKRLIRTPEAALRNIAYELTELLYQPALLRNDPIIFLGVRTAASRLHYVSYSQNSLADIAKVIELLWDIALRQEDGNLPHAAKTLATARKELERLLQDPNATDAQIAQATQDLQQALAQYFQEIMHKLQQRMAESGAMPPMLSPDAVQNLITPEDIASFLDQLRAEAMSGDKTKALELLSQLQQFADRLTPSMNMTMPPEMEFMMEGVNELKELIEKQKELLADTELIARIMENYPPTLPQDSYPESWNVSSLEKTEQDSLRYILGQLMLDADSTLGSIPDGLQNAEQAMRGSSTALAENAPAQSIPYQEEAIEELENSMQALSQQIQQMMKNMAMMALGAMNLDPLGRPLQEGNGQSPFPGSTIKIPDEGQRKKVEDILQELRKRSGEYSRPDYELEYYRRLLKQF